MNSLLHDITAWEWDELRTEHFVLRFQRDSHALEVVDEVARRAESAYQRGREWFGGAPSVITAYLVGWLEGDERDGWIPLAGGLLAPDGDVIWQVVNSENPALGLERLVLQIVTRSSFGSLNPESSGPLRSLARLLAAEQGIGVAVEEAHSCIAGMVLRRSTVPKLFPLEDPDGPTSPEVADLSFLAFVLGRYGAAAFARFARGSILEGPTAAAMSAWSLPLGKLKADWLETLRSKQRKATSTGDVLRRAFPYLRRYWLREAELVLYMLLDVAFVLAIPLSTKFLFDNVIAQRAYSLLGIWLAVVLGLFAASSLLSYRRLVVGGMIGEWVQLDLARQTFAQLQRLSLRFYSRSRTGDLMSRLTRDVDAVRGVLGETLPQLAFQLASLVAGAALLLALNWILAILVLGIGIPIFAIAYSRTSRHFRRASRELQDELGSLDAFLQENLSAQMVVKSFSMEKQAANSFGEFLIRLYDLSMRLFKLRAVLSGSSGMIYQGIRVLVLGVGALLILDNRLTIGELVAFSGMIVQVLQPITTISNQYRQLQLAVGAFDRIEEVMQEVPDVVEDHRAVELAPLEREIRLEHVRFRYGEGQSGLHDVSMTIPAGRKVAVVGPSGAGKSTLFGLLLRLYDPNEGRILFDGKDIREATFASLRRQITVVPQDSVLFNTTIRANIAVGLEDATDEQVTAAAKAAALDQVIEEIESGYATIVGERGLRLSGGQRQRMAIARALIRDPRVLILDEATSALDPETESAVMAALRKGDGRRTTIMITHRLASVVDCDLIFVLDHGRLVEQGTHQELCEHRSVYWRMYSEQQAGVMEAQVPSVDPGRLAAVPLFASLTPAERAAIALRVSVERYRAGDIIVREGELADKLYVIDDGEVEVLADGHQDGANRLKLLRARSYFGEIALLRDGMRRTATVRAVDSTKLYTLHKDDFAGLLWSQPRLAEAVERLAGMRSSQTERASRARLAGR